MYNLFLIFLLLYISLVLATYSVGHLFFKFNKLNAENIFVTFFVKCSVGVALIVCLYSILINGFGTIFFGTLPILIYFIYVNRKAQKTDVSKKNEEFFVNEYSNKKLIGGICISAIVIFIVNSFIVNKFQLSMWLSNPHSDYIYYSKISKYLSIYRQENVFYIYNEMLPQYFNGIVPYHYFDLWLNNLLLNFHQYSTYLSCQLIVIPFLLFLIFLGIAAILSFYLKSPWMILTASFSIIYFFGGIVTPLYEYLPKTQGIEGIYCVIQAPHKIYPIYLYVLLFIISILLNKRNLAIFSLCFLVFVYSQTFPAIIGGFILLIVYLLFRKNYTDASLVSKFLLLTVIGFASVFLLNHNPEVLQGNNPYSLSYLFANFQTGDLRTMFNIAVVTQYWMALVYIIPLILTVITAKYLIKDEKLKFISILFGFIYLSSLFGWMLFFKELNSVQIFTNIAQPMANLLSLLIIFSLMKKDSTYFIAVIGFALIIVINITITLTNYAQRDFNRSVISENFDPDYYGSIKKIVDRNIINNKIGVSLYGADDFKSIYFLNNVHELSNALFVYNDNYQAVGLGDFEMNVDRFDDLGKMRGEFFIKTTFFRNYLEKTIQSKNYPCKDFPKNAFEHQLQYIIDNKVEYAFVSPHYPYWNRLSRFVNIQFENDLNKEKFVIFKKTSELSNECNTVK